METAEEIILKQGVTKSPISGIETYLKGNAKSAMIEFAKLHVEAALLAASEKGTLLYPDVMGFPPIINPDSILNAYPLENIK